MKKLFAAAPVLVLVCAWTISSCVGGDQGTGNGGLGGAGGSTTSQGGSDGNGQGGARAMGGAPGAGGSQASGGASGVDASTSMGGMTGSGGATGAGGAITGAGGSNLMDVARVLNGQMLLGPCVVDRLGSVCHTVPLADRCPVNATDRALTGVLTTDKPLTFGGTPGVGYTVRLHVQGVVEAKQYTGGVDKTAVGNSPRADGFAVGGTPTTANDYNVYMLRVTNPGMPKVDYFFNSLVPPGVSNHTTYGVDFVTGDIKIMGGAALRLVAGDSNCDMIKNCGPTQNDGTVCAAPIIMTGIDPMASALNPGFNFNTAYNGQWLVMVVASVTSP